MQERIDFDIAKSQYLFNNARKLSPLMLFLLVITYYHFVVSQHDLTVENFFAIWLAFLCLCVFSWSIQYNKVKHGYIEFSGQKIVWCINKTEKEFNILELQSIRCPLKGELKRFRFDYMLLKFPNGKISLNVTTPNYVEIKRLLVQLIVTQFPNYQDLVKMGQLSEN